MKKWTKQFALNAMAKKLIWTMKMCMREVMLYEDAKLAFVPTKLNTKKPLKILK